MCIGDLFCRGEKDECGNYPNEWYITKLKLLKGSEYIEVGFGSIKTKLELSITTLYTIRRNK